MGGITLYVRERCPLCEEARLVLELACQELGAPFREIDIESNERLLEKYQLMIPVVEVDGDVLMYGRVTYTELLDRLNGEGRTG